MRNTYDVWFILPLIGLSAFGAFNIFGIRPELLTHFLVFLVVGWVAFIAASRMKIPLLEQNYKIIYAIFIVLFLATILLGSDIRGSKRWIQFFSFRFQTSEFFKPVFLIAMASVLSSANRFSPRKLIIAGGLFLLPFLLIFNQPDLGSSLLYFATFLTMFYFSGLSTQLMFRGGIFATLMVPVGWLFMKDYQKARVIGFFNPNVDPQGLTYNITQSIISIGSGGWTGKGLGLGTQSRFRFLPEFHTDFAFASLVEQFGFVGGIVVIGLFAWIMAKVIQKIFASQENEFVYLYLIGTVAFLMIEIVINIGMNMGLMPVTGIALPFISYGGSSIVSTMIMLGLALAM